MMPQSDCESICAAEFIPWEKLRGKRILITGATGLIGFSLTSALLYANEKMGLGLTILALVREEARARRRFAVQLTDDAPLHFLVGTVENLPNVDGPVDYILHGASQTASGAFVNRPVETIQTAVLGTLALLELAREKRCSGFVYLSSMEVYGHPPRGHKVAEVDACNLAPLEIRNSYPVAKLQCESLCCAYAREYGVPAMIVRLAQTFGPDFHPDDRRIFAEFLRCARDGRDIVLRTRGETERSYLYVSDAVTALLTILLRGQPGQAYNAADERTYCSIAEMAQKLASANGVHVRFDLLDAGSLGYPRPVYMDLDTSRLRALGWSPREWGGAGDDPLQRIFAQMMCCFASPDESASFDVDTPEERGKTDV